MDLPMKSFSENIHNLIEPFGLENKVQVLTKRNRVTEMVSLAVLYPFINTKNSHISICKFDQISKSSKIKTILFGGKEIIYKKFLRI